MSCNLAGYTVGGNRLPYVLRISPLLQFVNSTHPLNNYKKMSKYCRIDEVLRKSGASNMIDGKSNNIRLADVICSMSLMGKLLIKIDTSCLK